MKRGVFWYRFAYRYEKFRPFWSEQNNINNNGKDMKTKKDVLCYNIKGHDIIKLVLKLLICYN